MQVNEKRFEMFEVVFISPSGVELKSMRQVKQYVEVHGSTPDISENSIRAQVPQRRSRRLSDKAMDMLELSPK
jgi:hypothetical protein